jgi:hypothetical protein
MTDMRARQMANAPPDMRAIIAEGIPPEVLFNIMGIGSGGMTEINHNLMRQFIASQIASVRRGRNRGAAMEEEEGAALLPDPPRRSTKRLRASTCTH